MAFGRKVMIGKLGELVLSRGVDNNSWESDNREMISFGAILRRACCEFWGTCALAVVCYTNFGYSTMTTRMNDNLNIKSRLFASLSAVEKDCVSTL
jgi:hypothetical protein